MEENKSRWPLYLLLIVQLLGGIALMPSRNFISIYLNEVIAFPVREVARVMALGQAVGMLAALVGGALSDRWGHKWMLALGTGVAALGSLLYVARVPWIVMLLWCAGSAALSLSSLSSQGYLTLAAGTGALGIFSALYNWGYTVGGAIGNPLAAAILGEDNYTPLGLALTGFGLFTMLITLVLPHLRPHEQVRASTGRGYSELLRRPRILVLGLLRFLPTCYYGLITLLPLLIKQQGGTNADVAWYAAVSSILASLAQALAGWTADRLGVRRPTQIAFGVILVAIVGTILTTRWVWGLYIFGALGLCAAWALSTLLPGLVTKAAEPEIRGRVFGLLHLLWTFAMILGTLLGGEFLQSTPQLAFATVGVLNVIALALTVTFFRMTKSQPNA